MVGVAPQVGSQFQGAVIIELASRASAVSSRINTLLTVFKITYLLSGQSFLLLVEQGTLELSSLYGCARKETLCHPSALVVWNKERRSVRMAGRKRTTPPARIIEGR